MDWKVGLLFVGLKWLSAPLWVPGMFVEDIALRARTAPLVRGRVEDAWGRCSAVWREVGLVCQDAAHHGADFCHELAVALGSRHRNQKAFFLEQLKGTCPLLAAYAFKCLVRTCQPRREEMPPGALQRTEPIRVLWADLVHVQTLGAYLEGWFVKQEWFTKQRNTWLPRPTTQSGGLHRLAFELFHG
jgi:hypothetical protein